MLRSIITIMRRAMRKNNTIKSHISAGCIVVGVSFCLSIIMIFYIFNIKYARYKYRSPFFESFIFEGYDEHIVPNYLFVNPPDSFTKYLDGIKQKDFLYHTADIEAEYDFFTCNKLMNQYNSTAAVVFPHNSNELLRNGETLEILTYSNTDSLVNILDESSAKSLLEGYNKALFHAKGFPAIDVKSSTLKFTGTPVARGNQMIEGMVKIVPLLIFVIVLFTIMTGGTNVIAGEKERGTFAAIVLTPAPRSAIVIGNILGISMLSYIPSVILCLLTYLSLAHWGGYNAVGLIMALLLSLSFVILMASITILISIINRTIMSAQTTYLPVFLIILGICINSIQKLGKVESAFLFLPIYGHFFGIGNALAANFNYCPEYLPYALFCILSSLVISVLLIIISANLLKDERFMTNSGGIVISELKNRYNRFMDKINIRPFIYSFLLPVFILSFVQLIALIPVTIKYMRSSDYSKLILSLRDVNSVPTFFDKTAELMSILFTDPLFLFSMALGYLLLIAIYCLKIRFHEHTLHPICEIGFRGRSAAKQYGSGLLMGFLMMTAVTLILIGTGNLSITGFGINSSNILILLIGIPMWIVQGAAEEVMFRGYMIPHLQQRYGKIFAVIYSSFLFAVLHGANIGFTPLAGINIFIFAILFALIYLYTDSLWFSAAAHTAWNFCQGSLYGLEVSGSSGGTSILSSAYTSSPNTHVTGGAFGPEGGIAVTIVVGLSIIVFISYTKIKSRRAQ